MSSDPKTEQPHSRSWTPEDLEKLDPRYTWAFTWSMVIPGQNDVGQNDVSHVALIAGKEVEHVEFECAITRPDPEESDDDSQVSRRTNQ